jgi:hypothetical protein
MSEGREERGRREKARGVERRWTRRIMRKGGWSEGARERGEHAMEGERGGEGEGFTTPSHSLRRVGDSLLRDEPGLFPPMFSSKPENTISLISLHLLPPGYTENR